MVEGREIVYAAVTGGFLLGPLICPESLREEEEETLCQHPAEEGEGRASLFIKREVQSAHRGMRPALEAAEFPVTGGK